MLKGCSYWMILNNYNDYLTYGGNEHEKRISTSFDSNFSTFKDVYKRQVPYEPGTLKAVAYQKDRKLGEYELSTAKSVTKLKVDVYKRQNQYYWRRKRSAECG